MKEKNESQKIGMVSLGCPKNTVDTELVLGDLLKEGFEVTADEADADVIIVNTCGFIESAKRESIDMILEMAHYKSRGKCSRLVVTGCLSERYSKELLKEIPEIDLVLGVNQYPELKSLLIKSNNGDNRFQNSKSYYESYGQRALTTPFYSAYLKLGEGCSFQCAFCCIPHIRGAFRSRPLEAIVNETRQLVFRGVREFNLVSQVTNLYGSDLKMKDGIVRLLEALCEVDGADWLRLLYCYPSFVDDRLLSVVAQNEKVCNYIDVPLQHVHQDMLKAMKRPEDEKDVRGMVERAREICPGIALRTTFIVGFPGETDAHFRKLADFLGEAEFDHVGIFEFSDEEGVQAHHYPDKIPADVAEERRDALMEIQRNISQTKNERRVGKTTPVLVEGLDEDSMLMTGRGPFQAPEIDGQIIIEESEVEPGQIVSMKVTRSMEYDLIARVE